MSKRSKYILLTIAIAFIACCVWGGAWAVRKAPELHARDCLHTITELADDTIRLTIPQHRYHEAIDAAVYIKSYYPPGTVLPEDHPFAREYEAERQRQILRIRDALRTVVDEEDTAFWRKWNRAIEEDPSMAKR